MTRILRHFDALTNLGLQIIPLWHNSKIPVQKGWNKGWNKQRVRSKFAEFPNCNLGVLLGEIVDVEGDSPEANHLIDQMIGDYPHPSYRSTRSTHHLFINPYPDLRIFKHKDIEFRGWGHQSVLPPSEHEGIKYRWINTDSFPIPPLPEPLREFFKTKTGKPAPNGCFNAMCTICKNPMVMHRKRYKLEREALARLGIHSWICRHCRTTDIREECRLVRMIWRRRK